MSSPRRPISCAFALLGAISLPLGGCPRKAQQPASTEATASAPLLPALIAWTIPLPSNPSAGGIGDDERLYVPLQTNRLVALSLESGEQVWESRDEISTTQPPIASGRSLFVATASALFELDAASGVTGRRVSLSAPPAGPLTRAGDLLLVPQEPDVVEAIRIADGERRWSVTLGAPARMAAAVGPDNATAYFPLNDGSLTAVSMSAGKILWTVRDLGTLSPVAASGDRVLVGSTDAASKTLLAFHAKSGAESWHLTTADVVGAAADDAVVYFVSKDNVLRAVSRNSGNQRWLKTMNTRPLLPPRVIDHQILVVGVSPVLALYDAKTGMPTGTYAFSGEFEGAILEGEPILAGGGPDGSGPRLILITRDGRVVALRPGSDKTKSDSGGKPGDKSSDAEPAPAQPDSTSGR